MGLAGGAGGQGWGKNGLSLFQKHYKTLIPDVGGQKSLPVYDRMSNNIIHYYSTALSLLPLLYFIDGLLKSSVNPFVVL